MSVAECNTSCTEVYLACILIENESVKAYLCFHTHEQRERDVSHHVCHTRLISLWAGTKSWHAREHLQLAYVLVSAQQ